MLRDSPPSAAPLRWRIKKKPGQQPSRRVGHRTRESNHFWRAAAVQRLPHHPHPGIFVMLSSMSTYQILPVTFFGHTGTDTALTLNALWCPQAGAMVDSWLRFLSFLPPPLNHAKPSKLSVCKYNLRCSLYIHFLCFVRLSKP